MKSYLLRGVPASLQRDACWMTGGAQALRGPAERSGGVSELRRAPVSLIVLLGLILLADWLFWGYGAGVSLVLFGVAIAGAAWLAMGQQKGRGVVIAAGALLLGMLPLVAYMQMLSLIFYGASVLGFSMWIALQARGTLWDVVQAGMRFIPLAPIEAVKGGKDAAGGIIQGRDFRSFAMAWGLPIGVGAIFLWLFVAGNPVFEEIVYGLTDINLDMERLVFWGAIAAIVWPFIVLHKMRQRLMVPVALPTVAASKKPALLNAQSVTNSLVLFNVMFALQTGLDAVYLWGGAELPDGMTAANYAHRGAYPLVATALLAGVFALLTRPYVQARKGLRILLLLWLAQNLALMVGAVLRLNLYVEQYGLTYLRVAAFIWMGMVAAGLVLIGWQVIRDRQNTWMLSRMAALLVVVLYACSFVNFANVIAKTNLERDGVTGMDRVYICELGPMALPAITDYRHQTGQRLCSGMAAPQIRNWREWGFRSWQVQGYLADNLKPEVRYE